jgi:hypothetical protein
MFNSDESEFDEDTKYNKSTKDIDLIKKRSCVATKKYRQAKKSNIEIQKNVLHHHFEVNFNNNDNINTSTSSSSCSSSPISLFSAISSSSASSTSTREDDSYNISFISNAMESESTDTSLDADTNQGELFINSSTSIANLIESLIIQ